MDVVVVQARVRMLIAGYPELVAVLAAAILGLSARRPLAWLAGHQGINVLLAVLVFATAVTIEPAALRRAAAAWRPLLAALVTGITVLPLLSWAVSRLVATGSLRDGVMTVGLAPCEIASVATTAMAAGEAALAAGALIGSTLTAVLFAGPVLRLEAGHASVSPGGIIANLALVVALPLAAGIALRAWVPPAARVLAGERAERAASWVALFAVAALVALIAAEVRLSAAVCRRYGRAGRVPGVLGGGRTAARAARRAAGGDRPAADHVDAGLRDRGGTGDGCVRPGGGRAARPVRHPRPGLGHRRGRLPAAAGLGKPRVLRITPEP